MRAAAPLVRARRARARLGVQQSARTCPHQARPVTVPRTQSAQSHCFVASAASSRLGPALAQQP
eukprot:3054729-Prymnesium_polylepis.1